MRPAPIPIVVVGAGRAHPEHAAIFAVRLHLNAITAQTNGVRRSVHGAAPMLAFAARML